MKLRLTFATRGKMKRNPPPNTPPNTPSKLTNSKPKPDKSLIQANIANDYWFS